MAWGGWVEEFEEVLDREADLLGGGGAGGVAGGKGRQGLGGVGLGAGDEQRAADGADPGDQRDRRARMRIPAALSTRSQSRDDLETVLE